MRPTPSFSKPPPSARIYYLPHGQTVWDIAERCREAGVAFAHGTTGGWGPRDLAGWLVNHYEPATAPTHLIVSPSELPRPRGGIDVATLERVVLAARAHLFEMLEQCASAWAGESFPRAMIDGMLVIGVQDTDGAIGYAPVRYPQLRLVDRVVSLFVADYLTRPNDYRDLVTCEECGDLAFDAIPCHASWCAEPPHRSDVVPAIDVPSHDTEPGLTAVPTVRAIR